jgi:hypothetical protein
MATSCFAVEEDYDAMCALLGPLDFADFHDGYVAYERRKSVGRVAEVPESDFAVAT